MSTDHVCAIVLNWNGAEATIKCIQSLRASGNVPVVVIDNDSAYEDYTRLERFVRADSGDDLWVTTQEAITQHDQRHATCLIRNNGNHGYAGGNNVGIDYAYRAGYDHFWVLNNDITVEPDTLASLLQTLGSDAQCGFSASVLVYADNPESVQCVGGGRLYPWLGKARLLGKHLPRAALSDHASRLPEPDYLMGASLLIRRAVVQRVGLMDERYFMYSEEVDWQRRAAAKGFYCRVSRNSVARHGDSASTQGRSHLFHYYRNRAAIMYNKKFHSMPCYVFSAIALASITVLQNWRSMKNIRYGIKGIAQGLVFSWR
jgi:GT2 family glycosyltransferase